MLFPGDFVFVDITADKLDLTYMPGVCLGNNVRSSTVPQLARGIVIATTSSECGPEALVLFSGFRLGWNAQACFKLVSARKS